MKHLFSVAILLYLLSVPTISGDCPVRVTSVDHVGGTVGQYFNFDKDVVDNILDHTDWYADIFNVSNSRTEQSDVVIIWNENNGGSTGDGHGRKDVGRNEGDWEVGDVLTFTDYSCENEKLWVMSTQTYASCDTVCSDYNMDYTCDLTEQQAMTEEECGIIWTNTTTGYDASIHVRDDYWGLYPEAADSGWDDASRGDAPCQLESNGRLWYMSNKDSGVELDCNPAGSIYQYSLCSCDTGAPSLCVDEVAQFVWEELVNSGTGKPYINSSLSVDEATLTLDITVDVDYLGASEADDNGYVYGTTYVIDFEDFNAHSDSIREPGTCQNRDDAVLGSAEWDDLWTYSETPNEDGHIGSTSYLAYPPGDQWALEMSPDNECGIIRYTTSLSWDDLMSCANYNETTKYITTVDEADSITLSGTLYVNVVSPFSFHSDYSFYRVYQLLSQPFQIVVSKTVYVIDSTGINLLTIDVIAVYKEDNENIFRLIILTESAEYLELNRTGLGDSLLAYTAPTGTVTDLSASDFKVLETAESTGCVQSKTYICSQLWQIKVENTACVSGTTKYTDFSGDYSITFAAECRDDLDADLSEYCTNWLTNHQSEIESSETGLVVLSTALSWKDTICDPLIFEVQFAATMQFFQDAAFVDEASDTALYQVGEDTIYVRITTNYPNDHFTVFETELVNVWICTFNPLNSPQDIEVGQMVGGCFSNNTDTDAFDGHDGHIYDKVNDKFLENFALNSTNIVESNVIQFKFVAPESIVRDTLYVHAQIEVSLTVSGARRRILLDAHMSNDIKEANQMDHFVDKVGITRSRPINPKPPVHNYHPQEPQTPPQSPSVEPFVISLQLPWVIAIGCLLALVLTVNIVVMYYKNCVRHNRGTYSRVKYQDSEFDEVSNSERDVINVASD